MPDKQRPNTNEQASHKTGRRGSTSISKRSGVSGAQESEGTLLQELLKSKEQFSLVAQAAGLGTWDWDLCSNELVWSARCFSLFGLPPDTAMSYEKFLGSVHPEDRARVEDVVKKAIESHADCDTEFRVLWPGGSLRWISARGRAYYDGAGQPIRMLGIASDVTERKRSDQALRESEAKFRSLFDNSLDAVFLTLPDGTINAANAAACTMFGMTEAEICKAGRAGVVDPDDHRLAAVLEERARNGKFVAELSFIRKDGTRFDGEVSSVIVDGQPVRSFVVIRDITKRKEAEEELRLISDRFQVSLRGLPVVVYNQDCDLRYTWLYCPDLGHSPAEIMGKRDRDLYPRAEDAELTEGIKADVIKTGMRRREEVELFWRGKERRYDLLVDPLRDIEGNIVGVTCAAIDITERKQAQEALIRSEKLGIARANGRDGGARNQQSPGRRDEPAVSGEHLARSAGTGLPIPDDGKRGVESDRADHPAIAWFLSRIWKAGTHISECSPGIGNRSAPVEDQREGRSDPDKVGRGGICHRDCGGVAPGFCKPSGQ